MLLSIIPSSMTLIFRSKGSRYLGDPEFVTGFKGVIVIAILVTFFFFPLCHVHRSQSYFLECFLFFHLGECSNLFGLTMTCAHQLGDILGNDRNSLWTSSPQKDEEGRWEEVWKVGRWRKDYVCFITFSCPRKLKMVYVSSD